MNKILKYTNKEELNHRRRTMTEEMLLNTIAFKVQQKGDQRLLSGSRYDSLFYRIEELKSGRIFSGDSYA